MFTDEKRILERHIKDHLLSLGFSIEPLIWSWIPFSGHWGISTSLFRISSKNPQFLPELPVQVRAERIAELLLEKMILPSEITRMESVKGYLNFYFDTGKYANQVISSILAKAENFGKELPTNNRVMVEYSQPNTHKAFHVGHLRNMVLGSSICRILDFAGHEVIAANYIGDIGLHVIKWLWNYINFHMGEEPPGDAKTNWMGTIYSEAIQKLEEKPDLEVEVRELFMRWDKRDDEIVQLWKKTRAWSLDAFQQVYDRLGIYFDRIYFESEVEDSGKQLVENLIQNGLAKDERPEGAVIIDLDQILGTTETYRVVVILRSDGTSLYPTKDIPLAIMKFEEFNLDESIYVIDVRQSLYLKQIFKILELMGYSWSKNCFHLAYEIVNLPGNVTIASREGTVVLLEDLIMEAEKRAMAIVEEKNPELDSKIKKDIAEKVALGAIKYSLLSRDNTKVITFDWETAMDVNGQAAPYIQYGYVRANSILRKVGFQIPEEKLLLNDLTEVEVELIDLLSRFPNEVNRAAKELKPLLIANYVYEIAKAFSNFYNECHVLTAQEELRDFRLRLVAAAKQVIANGLFLLGIQVPEVM